MRGSVGLYQGSGNFIPSYVVWVAYAALYSLAVRCVDTQPVPRCQAFFAQRLLSCMALNLSFLEVPRVCVRCCVGVFVRNRRVLQWGQPSWEIGSIKREPAGLLLLLFARIKAQGTSYFIQCSSPMQLNCPLL